MPELPQDELHRPDDGRLRRVLQLGTERRPAPLTMTGRVRMACPYCRLELWMLPGDHVPEAHRHGRCQDRQDLPG